MYAPTVRSGPDSKGPAPPYHDQAGHLTGCSPGQTDDLTPRKQPRRSVTEPCRTPSASAIQGPGRSRAAGIPVAPLRDGRTARSSRTSPIGLRREHGSIRTRRGSSSASIPNCRPFRGMSRRRFGLRSETRSKGNPARNRSVPRRSRSARSRRIRSPGWASSPRPAASNDSPASAQALPAVKVNRVFGHVSGDDLIDMFRIAIAPDTKNVSIVLKPCRADGLPLRAAHRARRGGPHPAQRGAPPGRGGDDREHPTGEGDVAIVPGRRGPGRRTFERSVGVHRLAVITSCKSPRRIRPTPRPRPARGDGPIPLPRNRSLLRPRRRRSGRPPTRRARLRRRRTGTPGGSTRASSSSGLFPCIPRGRWGAYSPIPILLPDVGSDRRRAGRILLVRLPVAGDDPGTWRMGGRTRIRADLEESASVVVLEGPGGFPVLAAASLASRPPLTDAAAGACLPELLESIGQASTTAVMASRDGRIPRGQPPDSTQFDRARPPRRGPHGHRSAAPRLHHRPRGSRAETSASPRRTARAGGGEMPGRDRQVAGARAQPPRAICGDRRVRKAAQVRRPRASTRGSRPGRSARQAA